VISEGLLAKALGRIFRLLEYTICKLEIYIFFLQTHVQKTIKIAFVVDGGVSHTYMLHEYRKKIYLKIFHSAAALL
jgi:hypothetical protein